MHCFWKQPDVLNHMTNFLDIYSFYEFRTSYKRAIRSNTQMDGILGVDFHSIEDLKIIMGKNTIHHVAFSKTNKVGWNCSSLPALTHCTFWASGIRLDSVSSHRIQHARFLDVPSDLQWFPYLSELVIEQLQHWDRIFLTGHSNIKTVEWFSNTLDLNSAVVTQFSNLERVTVHSVFNAKPIRIWKHIPSLHTLVLDTSIFLDVDEMRPMGYIYDLWITLPEIQHNTNAAVPWLISIVKYFPNLQHIHTDSHLLYHRWKEVDARTIWE